MQYTCQITTPKNTTIENPKVSYLRCAGGIIHHMDIMFPSGSNGLLHMCCYLGGHPICPSTEGMFHSGDDETITFREHIVLKNVSNRITIKTWNESEDYSHMLIFRVYVLPLSILAPFGADDSIVSLLSKIYHQERE